MSEVRTLHQLQNLDLETDTLTQELAAVEATLGETDELSAARQTFDDAREDLQRQQSDLRTLEYQSEDLGAAILPVDAKLYGGTVRNPKELGNIQRESELMKANRSKVEDQMLELMESIENTQKVVADRSTELTSVMSTWEASQREMAARQDWISAKLDEVRRSRQQTAESLSPEALATYEDLRRHKRGRGVARVERNTCQGCRIALPATIVQHARIGRQLTFCPSCGRILYAER